ncbi:trypsin-like [Haematobia irritans]|uniref:trypsin-like n=1 Tax=Haematobia irritans TaxID=7368 RepID=UPI003F5053D4
MALTTFGYILSVVCLVLFPSTILGSEIIPITNAPYLVQLWKGGQYTCAGSFIASNMVITSARCVADSNVNDMEVVGGASTLGETGYRRKVVKIVIPPRYSKESSEWVIAVMKLASPMKGYNMAIVRLNDITVKPDQIMQISGYEPTGQLHTVYAPIWKRADCAPYYSQMDLPTTNTCAANADLSNSCFGDPGSPVVSNGKLCGVVTHTFNCASHGKPFIIAGTNALSAFINNAMTTLTSP